MEPIFITLLVVVPILIIAAWGYLRWHTVWESGHYTERWILPIGQQSITGLSVGCIILMIVEFGIRFLSPHYIEKASPMVFQSWQVTLEVLTGASILLLISSLIVSCLRHKVAIGGLIISALGLFAAIIFPAFLPASKL